MTTELRPAHEGWPVPVLAAEPVTLREVTRHERGVLTRLGQLFRYDMSEPYVLPPNADGTFNDRQTDLFLASEGDRRAWLVLAAGQLAGYAITRAMPGGGRGIAAFWIARSYRRSGVGRRAAALLLATHTGRWHIAYQDWNPGAPQFWAAVATNAVGAAWTRRHDEPSAARPPDTWITFETSGPADSGP